MLKIYRCIVCLVIVLASNISYGQNIQRVSTHHTKIFDEGAAEIVVHDADNDRLIFTNANDNSLTWLDFSNPAKLSEIKSVNLDVYGGGINSVAYHSNVVVAAVEANVKQDPGKLVFFDKDGTYLADVTVGALPDMVTFSKDGKYIIAACEGEPSDDYTVDPNGAIAIVDVSAFPTVNTTVLDFTAYNDKMVYLKNKGIRFFGPGATVSMDMEPEYVTCANDSLAYVACQENNAIVVVDFKNAKILDIYSARYADHSFNGGTPELDEYLLNEQTDWPELGTPAYGTNTPTVMLGGFSGLFYDSVNSKGSTHIFYAIPDRGPNGDAVAKADVTPATTQNLRPFKLPNYQARIVKIVYDENTDEAKVDEKEQIFLTAADGTTPISGRGNVKGFDEIPVTYTDANTAWSQVDYTDGNGVQYTELPYDPMGGDFEGILRDKSGDFWMCDEYRPAIYKFNDKGVLQNRFVAKGINAYGETAGIFISEFAEGSSNNKYLEIFNPTMSEVSLDDYKLVNCSNGCANEGEFEFDNSGLFKGRTIKPGGTFIIGHPQAQGDILSKADTTFLYLSNGDDWWAILNASDSSIVDQIGISQDSDPGNGWDVAGVTDATKDHTLVRKGHIIKGSDNWDASRGTSITDSEWEVLDRPEADTVMSTYGGHFVAGKYGMETLPAVYNKRRANRGFEAIAYDYDEDVIYAFIQSPMYNPSSSTKNNSDVIRVLGVDMNGNPVSEYVYLLERNRETGWTDGRVDKMGDAVYMGNGKFRVLERDSGVPGDDESKKYIVEFTLVGATNILGTDISMTGMGGKTLEEMTADEIVKAGVQPVHRRVITNLPSIGYLPSDKPEGLAWIDTDIMAVINDNDFGLAGAGVSDEISLGIVFFSGDHGMDASNKDDEINIDNYPTLGMRLPDALTSLEQDGKIYILTANEGDSRDYDGFSEEERVADLTLDSLAYPDRKDLQEDDVMGRLKTTTTMGDYDNDGDFDQVYSYGSRSFTIYDQYGNIVFDSGDEFEQKLAQLLPDDFGSTNDENESFDNRSDDKGPEPEAITVGEWRDSTYAFIGLERIGGVMVYNITDVHEPYFVDYFNNRDFSQTDVKTEAVGDLGTECVLFLDSSQTPDKKFYVVTANEVSGTVSVFEWGGIPIQVGEKTVSTNWSLYPNPLNGSMVNTSVVDNYTVRDLSGRTLLVEKNTNMLDMTSFEKGSYLVTNSKGETKVLMRN